MQPATIHHSNIPLFHQSTSIYNQSLSIPPILSLFLFAIATKIPPKCLWTAIYELCSIYPNPSAKADGNPLINLYVFDTYNSCQINLTVQICRFKNTEHRTTNKKTTCNIQPLITSPAPPTFSASPDSVLFSCE